jgi:hypothetical protein
MELSISWNFTIHELDFGFYRKLRKRAVGSDTGEKASPRLGVHVRCELHYFRPGRVVGREHRGAAADAMRRWREITFCPAVLFRFIALPAACAPLDQIPFAPFAISQKRVSPKTWAAVRSVRSGTNRKQPKVVGFLIVRTLFKKKKETETTSKRSSLQRSTKLGMPRQLGGAAKVLVC